MDNFTQERKIKDFIDNQLKLHPNANFQVLEFIANVRYHTDENVTINLFSQGYCYYFALMLKEAFFRGQICFSVFNNHIVWRDSSGIAYDINGVYKDYVCLAPVEEIGDEIWSYLHVPGTECNLTESQVATLECELYEKYSKK